MKNQIQITGIFTDPVERGHQEWSAFEVVRGDRVDIFDVPLPHWYTNPRERSGVRMSDHAKHLEVRYLH